MHHPPMTTFSPSALASERNEWSSSEVPSSPRIRVAATPSTKTTFKNLRIITTAAGTCSTAQWLTAHTQLYNGPRKGFRCSTS